MIYRQLIRNTSNGPLHSWWQWIEKRLPGYVAKDTLSQTSENNLLLTLCAVFRLMNLFLIKYWSIQCTDTAIQMTYTYCTAICQFCIIFCNALLIYSVVPEKKTIDTEYWSCFCCNWGEKWVEKGCKQLQRFNAKKKKKKKIRIQIETFYGWKQNLFSKASVISC